MKAVAFSVKPFEKEYLAKANQKKHDITLISNPLGVDTAVYAEGKNAVIVTEDDDLSAPVAEQLAALGIQFIVTRSAGTGHLDKTALTSHGIKIANIQNYPPGGPLLANEALQEIADQTIKSLDLWSLNKCVGQVCACAKDCNKTTPEKTV
ncbi:lactate dehydrogenase [Mucilaginibacter sp.]|uniref:lactate dehydrogenase n=1 Tax=Mucilaginibacter sp. TaxID=1882438 RepID=UPI0025D5C565|nr:lactate dehydrogenase [Mucilaginibacter sp.]